jgi:hypothetical protein
MKMNVKFEITNCLLFLALFLFHVLLDVKGNPNENITKNLINGEKLVNTVKKQKK